jgi:hypothetical protein
VLLLNLLIALLATTFSRTQELSTLQGRMALARTVLRLELVAQWLGIDTRLGESDGNGCRVHHFRSVHNSAGGELPRDHKDESIYDVLPSAEPQPTEEQRTLAELKETLATVSEGCLKLNTQVAALTAKVGGLQADVGELTKSSRRTSLSLGKGQSSGGGGGASASASARMSDASSRVVV